MSAEKPLRILCFGAGAIGTYIGGSLAAGGHHVVFIDRPEMVIKLAKAGLRVEREDSKTIEISHPNVVSSLGEVFTGEAFDFSIIAVKAYDTDELIASWEGYKEKIPPVLCLQNGVENENKYAEVLSEANVIAGTVTTAIGKTGIGSVKVERLRGVGIADKNALANRIVLEMNRVGLSAALFHDAEAMKWSKMLTNLIANASSAILGIAPEKIFGDYDLFRIEVEQIRETLRVMDALKIDVIDLPGTPVRLLAFTVRHLHPRISQMLLKNALGKGRGDKMPSFYIDLEAGRKKSEAEYLNGAVVRYGKTVNIKTPVNKLLNKIMMGLAHGQIDRKEYLDQPQKLKHVLSVKA